MYWRVGKIIKYSLEAQNSVNEEMTSKMNKVKRLKYFPLCLIIAWFFGTVNRIYLFASPDDPSLELNILHNLFGFLSGFFNAVVYCLNTDV